MSSRRFRIKTTVVAAVAGVAAIAAACQPTKPPAPGPRDVDVLVVGDSIAAGLGCQLGDPGQTPHPTYPCPGVGGISAATEWAGACTIGGGWLSQYNRTANNTPNCWDWQLRFQGFSDNYNPELVILVTGGWEIVDRWSSQPCSTTDTFLCSHPDRQWANPNGTGLNEAKAAYRAALYGAINIFQNGGAKVLVVTQAYIKPLVPSQPVPVYWEPYGPTPPVFPAWQPPVENLPFGPSKIKVNNFNDELKAAVTALGDPNVQYFDAWHYFSPELNENFGGTRGYSPNICLNLSGIGDPLAHVTENPNNCQASQPIQVRHSDGGHFTEQGYQTMLAAMLPKIQQMLA